MSTEPTDAQKASSSESCKGSGPNAAVLYSILAVVAIIAVVGLVFAISGSNKASENEKSLTEVKHSLATLEGDLGGASNTVAGRLAAIERSLGGAGHDFAKKVAALEAAAGRLATLEGKRLKEIETGSEVNSKATILIAKCMPEVTAALNSITLKKDEAGEVTLVKKFKVSKECEPVFTGKLK